jgi:hypothetical protein
VAVGIAVLLIFAIAFPGSMVVAEKSTLDNPIFEDRQVGFKDAGIFGTHGMADLALDLQDLMACLDQSLLQPFNLAPDFFLGYRPVRDGLMAFPHDQNLAPAHPCADGYPAQNFFAMTRLHRHRTGLTIFELVENQIRFSQRPLTTSD